MKDYVTALAGPVGTLILGLFVLFVGRRRGETAQTRRGEIAQTLTGVPVSPGLEVLEQLGFIDGTNAEMGEAIELARMTPPDQLIPYLMTDLNKKTGQLRDLDAARDYWRDWARDHVARYHPDQPMPPEYKETP